jgi:hypothetical protein
MSDDPTIEAARIEIERFMVETGRAPTHLHVPTVDHDRLLLASRVAALRSGTLRFGPPPPGTREVSALCGFPVIPDDTIATPRAFRYGGGE